MFFVQRPLNEVIHLGELNEKSKNRYDKLLKQHKVNKKSKIVT